ncbi:MAG TPA: multifunctional CCA addition/repair protein [Casimicrobiaceae bacterium]|nr:multifunctional CCA addition/repair protein [Casimicrobiaceae bacterium]
MAKPRPQPFAIYRVGGSVRDELLGRPVQDRDWVVVGATPELLLASGYKPVGKDFPVFLHPETREEHALARTERKHGRGYHGFEFFASPDVTLEEDLRRRDLTINAMARDHDGTLIDPFGGVNDLRAGVLRHVSPAFAEDPLRVLRVARFAARFAFTVAPETEAAMRAIVASGELETLTPERVWQELSRGLLEAHPSRMLAALRACGALAVLLPEVDALYGVPQPPSHHPEIDAGVHVAMALDWSAAHGGSLPTRYAVLAHDLGKAQSLKGQLPRHVAHEQRSVKLADALSMRLRVPVDCRDVARLTARWHGVIHRAHELTPAKLLDVLTAVDGLRRPERLDEVLAACAADACSRPGASQDYPPARLLRDALAIVKQVDAAPIARNVTERAKMRSTPMASDAIPKAIRSARIAALRDWKKSNAC